MPRMNQRNVVFVGIEEGLDLVLRREVANAGLEVEYVFQSGLMAIDCLRHYRKQPRLLLVQISANCEADTIRGLNAHLGGWPILALVPSQEPDDLLRINRAGAVQMVPLPPEPADLQQAFKVISSYADREALDRQVLAVTGAAGGSGATTVALNLAYEIAETLDRATILAELSLQMGTLATMLDLEPRFALPHLIREIQRVDDFLVDKTLLPFTNRLRILAGPQELNAIPSVAPEHLVKIVGCLKQLASVTLVDMPGTFDDLEFEVLKACDTVIVVANQTIPSIKSLKMFCESLSEERVVHSLWVVLNRYDPTAKGMSVQEIREMLGIARVFTITSDHRAANLAVNKGRPLRLVAPGTKMLQDIDRLMYEILGEDVRPEQSGLIGRVLSALKRPEKSRRNGLAAVATEAGGDHLQ
jgi:pilus assembly protein CpaE